MWFVFALLSSVFAALTSILAKVGIDGVNSNLATAIRTAVVLVMSWGMVFLTHTQSGISAIGKKSWLFLILSGLATGASWLCYYKALQMGNVWRADRPQRGRYRQFMQCDIDILGEPSNLAEIELILATTTLLGKLDFENFTIRINNRKILKGMAAFCGFPEEEYDEVFIILDKMDKIGMDGVVAELLEAGYAGESVEKCKTLFETVTSDIEGVRYMKDTLGEFLEEGSAEDLETIISTVEKVKTANFKIVFDPTLVRGMSYYTGPIFEIAMDEFGGSVGGGGRYDEMIGKFTGNNTCACGFSIGFERIVMLLLERDYKVPSAAQKKAYLIDKKASADVIAEVIEKAKAEREKGIIVAINIMKKNKKFQKEQLMADGYEEIEMIYAD